jgi:hypothetical protein
MASPEPIALVNDVLRGQLLAVSPAGATVIVGAPSPDGHAMPGLFVHPLRVATSKSLRNTRPEPYAGGARLLSTLDLEIDYLIAGLGGETLAELALLDAALRWLNESPMHTHDTMGEGLSQAERWAALASGSLTVRWLLQDMPLEQMAAVWVATGLRQRAGLFLRAEVSWREGQPAPGPVVEI